HAPSPPGTPPSSTVSGPLPCVVSGTVGGRTAPSRAGPAAFPVAAFSIPAFPMAAFPMAAFPMEGSDDVRSSLTSVGRAIGLLLTRRLVRLSRGLFAPRFRTVLRLLAPLPLLRLLALLRLAVGLTPIGPLT